MVGLCTTHLIWDKLTVYYASHTRAKVCQLKLQLESQKRDRTASTYLLAIKRVFDSLTAIGSPISSEDHIDTILVGLPEEYDNFITFITSQLDPYTIQDIESLILAQEDRFDKHKFLDSSPAQANISSTNWIPSSSSKNSSRSGRASSRVPYN